MENANNSPCPTCPTPELSPESTVEVLIVFSGMLVLLCIVFFVTKHCHRLATLEARRRSSIERHRRVMERKEYVQKSLITRQWTMPSHSVTERECNVSLCENGQREEADIRAVATVVDVEAPLSPVPTTEQRTMPDDFESCSSTCSSHSIDKLEQLDADYEKDTGPECAICLSCFQQGDSVVESVNTSCRHVFHAKCMYGWLLRHDECPVCRAVYLKETV